MKYDFVSFTFPTQSHLVDFFEGKTRIFILSDPYHLMKQDKSEEAYIISKADYIFCTAKNLAEQYISKYFGKTSAKIIYWPNCVDVDIWNLEKFTGGNSRVHALTIGFAGNFMKVTDIQLLYETVVNFPQHNFVLAGKVEGDLDSVSYALIEKTFSLPNVTYKGLIPYNSLQKEIASWDIGLMIDKANEIASYHHHNKFYQYMAMGLPVVYQRNHNDYDDLASAFPATDADEFKTQLQRVIAKIEHGESFKSTSVTHAKNNTNAHRADLFLRSLA